MRCLMMSLLCVALLMGCVGQNQISGVVTDVTGRGLGDVPIEMTSDDTGETKTTVTQEDGEYKLAVFDGFSGTVRAVLSLPIAQVNPTQRYFTDLRMSIVDQNFVARFIIVTISGTVTFIDGSPFEGVTMTAVGTDSLGHDVNQTTATNSDGFYSFSVPYGFSGVVTPISPPGMVIEVPAGE